jgi:hypothetical protein
MPDRKDELSIWALYFQQKAVSDMWYQNNYGEWLSRGDDSLHHSFTIVAKSGHFIKWPPGDISYILEGGLDFSYMHLSILWSRYCLKILHGIFLLVLQIGQQLAAVGAGREVGCPGH